jgi:hypothetical protein
LCAKAKNSFKRNSEDNSLKVGLNPKKHAPNVAKVSVNQAGDPTRQKPASNLKRFANTSNCRLSGCVVPSSHEWTKAVATPIFAAKWQGVRFFSWRLT